MRREGLDEQPKGSRSPGAGPEPERLTLLASASAILASSLDVAETLRGLARVIVPQLADLCAIRLRESDGSLPLSELAHADPAQLELARSIEERWPAQPDAPGGVPRAVRTGESSFVAWIEPAHLAAAAVSPEHADALAAIGIRSAMIVPLKARGRIMGAISMATTRFSERSLHPDDLALTEEIAARAALAIDNARLFAEAEHARLAAVEAASRLRIFAEANNALASSLDDDTALRTLAEVCVRTLADYAITYTHEADGRIRRVGLAHSEPEKRGLVEALVRAGHPRLSDPYGAGAVIRTGRSICASEIPDEMLARGAQNEEHLRILRMLAPRSAVVAPLEARGRIIGALTVAATDASGRRYRPDDVLMVEDLAWRAALMVDNARLYREAQEALQARKDLIAAVSHDLRSPLHVIRTAASLLASPALAPERRERTLSAIGHAAEQMDRFVHRLLDASRIEAGRVSLELSLVDVVAIVSDSVALSLPLAEEKSVRLELASEGPIPSVLADAERLRQVLSNLLGNAIKFVPEHGEVEVVVRSDGESVRVSVSDTGPGIAEHELPRVFDAWRAGSTRRGTGLGLAIVKGIVEAHGGTVSVTSALGHGSTFEFTLPARSSGATPLDP